LMSEIRIIIYLVVKLFDLKSVGQLQKFWSMPD
jgi:hypothetical protein